MSSPATLQADFRRMERDSPRNRMRQASLWNAIDYIPENGAPIRERGGWSNVAAVSAVSASATQIRAGLAAPFTAGGQILAIDEDGLLWKYTSGGTVTLVGTALTPLQNPVFHANTIIIPSDDGVNVPKKYDGSTIANLSGTAPPGRYACYFKDYTVLANSVANPRRQWFSEEGAPAGVWDTTYSLIDYSRPIIGQASLRNAILVFHKDTVSRLRGSSPPASSDTGDFVRDDPAFHVGCLDARSIVEYEDEAFWASAKGVYRSDGVAFDDLTKRAGMTQYWQDLVAAYATTWTLGAGIFNDTYVLCIMNGATFIDAFALDVKDYHMTRISNLDAITFWNSVDAIDELYWGRRGAGVVAKGSSMWTPASGNKADGNGTNVLGILETPFYEGAPGPKRVKSVYIGSELTDYATDNPTITLGIIRTPEDATYDALSLSIAESTIYQRTRHTVGGHSTGFALKLTRVGAGNAKLYSIEAEIDAEEPGRRTA